MMLSTLTDDIVTLRPFQLEDSTQLYEAVHESLTDLKPWMSWAHRGYSQAETEELIRVTRARWEEKTIYGFGIVDTKTGDILGGCGLSHFNSAYHFCNLGYWVRTSRHGEGIAGRAAKIAARFAFEEIGLIRAEIVIAVGNEKSRRVAEKIGAHNEGVLLNRMVVGKVIHDAHMYSLIPRDFGLSAR